MNFFNRIGNFFKVGWASLHFKEIEKLVRENITVKNDNVQLKKLLIAEERKSDLLEKRNKILEESNRDLKDGLSSLGLYMEEILPHTTMDQHKKDRFEIMIKKITG